MSERSPHSEHSSRREKILENLFIGEVLRNLWNREGYNVELLQSDIDAAGYDLVLSLPNGLRYIQLKAMTRAKSCKVNGKISDKIGGCVVVMIVSEELKFKNFLWFGNSISKNCEDVRQGRVAKHEKGNSTGFKAARKDSYVINRGQFDELANWDQVVNNLLSEEL